MIIEFLTRSVLDLTLLPWQPSAEVIIGTAIKAVDIFIRFFPWNQKKRKLVPYLVQGTIYVAAYWTRVHYKQGKSFISVLSIQSTFTNLKVSIKKARVYWNFLREQRH